MNDDFEPYFEATLYDWSVEEEVEAIMRHLDNWERLAEALNVSWAVMFERYAS